ncbi:DNA repair and recombination protein RAD26 [Lophiotrema nucula]|uniref:DNA repair and recombination protein RAD26 n=1 Tax=Lophiotrema nucula TaxID=690887 RepID=A0A6A5ZPT5_9PLEO|nr:DNA repair and recombination protein RAD26 [Lophiotrema nucula]
MIRKAFKPPTFVRPDAKSDEPPQKKRRVSSSVNERLPLVPLPNAAIPTSTPNAPPENPNERYYSVLWRKYTTKKNKTWDGDGVLAVVNGYATLTNSDDGKELGKSVCNRPLLPGSALSMGGKEVEIEDFITKENFMAGRHFLGKAASRPVANPNPAPMKFKPLPPAAPGKSKSGAGEGQDNKAPVKTLEERAKAADNEDDIIVLSSKPVAAIKEFKTPLLPSTVVPKTKSSKPQPRHDPAAPNALVMKRPSSCPKGKQIVDVVVDPILTKHLREHQRDGVQFLYECIMGMRCEGEGAIMADEMGLGKTLQTITLLWTLMKQNPIDGNSPVVTKALIVCPAGLIGNWQREIRKWLGNERIGVFVVDSKDRKNKKITNFTMGKAYNVMIVGYEMLRVVQDELKKGSGVDIVIADEGHRLKTANNKAMLAIQSLNTERRIILSGTPLQNDLGEFYTAIDFVNPGLLGKRAAFKREFENPIVRSRQPNASESEIEKGEARWKELVSLTGQFMIRRTAEVLAKYLPPKTEHIVFCKPTVAQATAYRNVLASPIFAVALGNTDMALPLINVLKKLCNSPSLLRSTKDGDNTPSEMLQSLLPLVPQNILASHAASAKLRVLDSLIHKIRTTTKEKIVIVSNYTTTLDMIQQLLVSLSYKYLRLDGSTPAAKRQSLVEKFNRTDQKEAFAFLLSAKSGGVGLNLIGASRIVLFDIDWNPATDLQAMARIHRDGQKLPCKIYRLLVQGALDEKIYQRQVMKMGLANAVVDNKASASTFSREELKDLFRLNEQEQPQTHDLLNCTCEGHGIPHVDDIPDVLDEAEDDEGNAYPSLKKASEVDVDEQETKLKRHRDKLRDGEQPKLRMLMEYAHIDVNFLREVTEHGDESEELEMAMKVDDDVLLDVVKEKDCRVSFLLTKRSS